MNLRESLDVIRRASIRAPVPVFAIAQQLGLELCFIPMPQNISGQIRRTTFGTFAVDVNRNQANTRQRFTVAHELGHYLYHRDLLGKGVGDTLAFRAEGTDFPNPNITITHERQANTFASNLLMPNHLIRQLQAAGITTPAALANALMVSPEAMRIKLGLARTEFRNQRDPEEEDETLWTPPQF